MKNEDSCKLPEMFLTNNNWFLCILNNFGLILNDFSCFSSKMCQKWPQSWSHHNRSRADGRKWWSPSDFSWFETLAKVKLLFLEVLLMMKTLGWRRKKPTARGPPKIARRAPLGGSWRRVLRTIYHPNTSETSSDSWEPNEIARQRRSSGQKSKFWWWNSTVSGGIFDFWKSWK